MNEHRDIEFATRDSGSLHLDLFLPETEPSYPLVVWIHGGAWREGDRTWIDDHALELPERGYALASVEYRLTDVATFPAQILDCRAAVRWLCANAREFGIDRDSVAVWGVSAGAHLAALLGTAPEVSFGESFVHPDASHAVDVVVDFFGPSDLRRMGDGASDVDHAAADSPESELLGGRLADRRTQAEHASPTTHVDGSEPPFLVVHGSADPTVPRSQSDLLVSALADADDAVTYHVVPGGGHGWFEDPAVPALVEGFLDRHLR